MKYLMPMISLQADHVNLFAILLASSIENAFKHAESKKNTSDEEISTLVGLLSAEATDEERAAHNQKVLATRNALKADISNIEESMAVMQEVHDHLIRELTKANEELKAAHDNLPPEA